MSAMEILKSKAMEQDAQTLFECVVTIGGGIVDVETRMVRAAMIDAYIAKTSEEEGDALMDLIGL